MGVLVCSGATCTCSFGTTPSNLAVTPQNKVLGDMPFANISDNKPTVNIPPFGMCQSLANPQVASATSAAMGVLTPMPCMPVTSTPWAPGSPTVLIANMPALNNSSKLICNWGGIITITNPGQNKVLVP
ncbi:MAG: DUF4280 domain-containing protein [Clostridia bacterium]|nr:DUF4280 domain-containing protein [Clostridia bacterium]